MLMRHRDPAVVADVLGQVDGGHAALRPVREVHQGRWSPSLPVPVSHDAAFGQIGT
jgi:hypothetical protein